MVEVGTDDGRVSGVECAGVDFATSAWDGGACTGEKMRLEERERSRFLEG